jgi:hypothetical protein
MDPRDSLAPRRAALLQRAAATDPHRSPSPSQAMEQRHGGVATMRAKNASLRSLSHSSAGDAHAAQGLGNA